MTSLPKHPSLAKKASFEAGPAVDVTVLHAETGESYVLTLDADQTVADVQRQASEYTNVDPRRMILLSGAPPFAGLNPRSSLSDLRPEARATVYLYSRDSIASPSSSLSSTRRGSTPTVPSSSIATTTLQPAGGSPTTSATPIEDPARVLEELQGAAERARVMLGATRAAVGCLVETSAQSLASYDHFKTDWEKLHAKHGAVSSGLDRSIEELARSGAAWAADREAAWRSWANELERHRYSLESRMMDLAGLVESIRVGAETVSKDYEKRTQEDAEALDAELAAAEPSLARLRAMEIKAGRTVNEAMRRVAATQKKTLDLGNKLAVIKAGLAAQDLVAHKLEAVHRLPAALEAAREETARRKRFAKKYLNQVSMLADFVARERDLELEKRDAFKRQFGKYLVPEGLAPGLFPGTFPPCDVRQRELDPQLRVSKEEEEEEDASNPSSDHDALASSSRFSAEEEEADLDPGNSHDPFRLIRLVAEIDRLRSERAGGDSAASSRAGELLAAAHAQEVEALQRRVRELEAALRVEPRLGGEEEGGEKNF